MLLHLRILLIPWENPWTIIQWEVNAFLKVILSVDSSLWTQRFWIALEALYVCLHYIFVYTICFSDIGLFQPLLSLFTKRLDDWNFWKDLLEISMILIFVKSVSSEGFRVHIFVTQLVPLVLFYTPWQHQKTTSFLRNQ